MTMTNVWPIQLIYDWPVRAVYTIGLFIIGTVVGSFLNVCIYRIPWEKSVIWPASHCPRCWGAIQGRDNVPILGWLLLRGRCRRCGLPISPRYPIIEGIVGLLFAGAYLFVAVLPGFLQPDVYIRDDVVLHAKVAYHAAFIALLVVITMIDADLTIVPASVTNLGLVIGLAVGTIFPGVRPAPSAATTHWGGFGVGLMGVLVGGGLIWLIRVVGGFVFRREAMGSGDIHILAMIGAFLGWQAALVTIPVAAFLGLVPALAKLSVFVFKRITRRRVVPSDRELPFGPFLSGAALILLFSWPWSWSRGFEFYFDTFRVVFSFLMGWDR